MKTKNFFGWLMMAAMLAGTGCSTDEVVNDFSPKNAIQFGTYVGRDAESRAHVIKVDELAEEGFGVFAYYTKNENFVAENNATTDATASTPNFMYNQKVTGKATTTGEGNAATTTYDTDNWEYSPLKYWPNNKDEKVSFFAYAPHSVGGDGTNFTFSTTAGLPTLDFVVNSDVKKQQDLLWAAPCMNLVKHPSTGTGIDIDDKVSFEFKHALARIGFDVQTMIDKVNGDDATGNNKVDDETTGNGENLDNATTVVVKKVTLKGKFITSGTLAWKEGTGEAVGTYSADITNSTSPTNETIYTLEAKKETDAALKTNFKADNQTHSLGAKDVSKLTVYGQSVNGTETQLNADDSYIMIIPKSFTDNDKLTIEVTYDVVTADSNLSSGYSQVTNVIDTSFSGINFEAGKAYKFSLHLGMTSVKLSATVADWKEHTTTEGDQDYAVNVPLNIEDDDTPTP